MRQLIQSILATCSHVSRMLAVQVAVQNVRQVARRKEPLVPRLPELVAASDALITVKEQTEKVAGAQNARLSGYAERANGHATKLRKAVKGQKEAPAPAAPALLAVPAPDADVVDVDPLTADESDGLAAADDIPTLAQLCVGARVHDRVIGDAGTVRQTAAEGGGKVLVEYDDRSVSHGQQTPLWRTLSDGHVVLLRA